MFEKILYPTDFSDEAMKALEFIKQLKGAGAKEVIALHVIDRRGLNDLARFSKKDLPGIMEDLEKKTKGEMSHAMNELKEVGLEVKLRVEKGGPYNEILKVADEENVSLIVIGSQGKGNIDKMLLGSVSYKLVKSVKRPILVIKS